MLSNHIDLEVWSDSFRWLHEFSPWKKKIIYIQTVLKPREGIFTAVSYQLAIKNGKLVSLENCILAFLIFKFNIYDYELLGALLFLIGILFIDLFIVQLNWVLNQVFLSGIHSLSMHLATCVSLFCVHRNILPIMYNTLFLPKNEHYYFSIKLYLTFLLVFNFN